MQQKRRKLFFINDFIDSSHFFRVVGLHRHIFHLYLNNFLKTGEGEKEVKRGSAQHCEHHHHRRQRAHTRRHLNCLSTTSSNSRPLAAGTRHGSGCRCGRASRQGCCPSWSAFGSARGRFDCVPEASRWSRFAGCRWRFSRATFGRRRRSECPWRSLLLGESERGNFD